MCRVGPRFRAFSQSLAWGPPLGETASSTETLRRWTWAEARNAAAKPLRALPKLVRAGWRDDADRRGLFVPALMGMGVGFYFALPAEPPVWVLAIAALVTGGWFALSRRFESSWITLLGALAAVTAGFALATVRTAILAHETITAETRTLQITGRIVSLEPADRGRTRLVLDVFETAPSLRQALSRVRVSIGKSKEALAPGDWVRVRATLRPLPAPVAPGSFDFGRQLWFQGIGAVGFSLAPVLRVDRPREVTALKSAQDAIERFRRAVSERILSAMSPRAGPIGAAFLTGERGLISDEDNEAMRDSSLAHLLSISGLHMALAGFGFFAALRLLFALIPPVVLRFAVKKWAAGAALLASIAYLLLSGASVPTQRSFVMVAVALIAIMFDRSALNMRVLAISAVAILVLSPESWMDPSFQMSFAAVAALIAVYEWWNARRVPDVEPPGPIWRALRMVAAAAATSFVAGLATAPFAAFHFNRFADYGVAANVIVTPIVSFIIMPAGVLGLLLMPFGIEGLPLAVMEKGIDAMLAVAHWVASWPGATQAVGTWPIASLALVAGGGIWLMLWRSGWRWFGTAPIAIGLILPLFVATPDVIVAADGANVAIRGADGRLHMLSPRRGRFDAEIWLRRDGDEREVAEAMKDDAGGFVCDAAGCIGAIRGNEDRRVVVAQSAEAAIEDCASALIMIDLARGARPPCKGPQLIVTAKLLSREGAIAARLSNGSIVTETVARERGDRPWTGAPAQ